jgi:hypothetical protein
VPIDPDAYRNLSDLGPAEAAQADALVRQAQAAADEAEGLASSTIGNAWRDLIGADSTSEALAANAKAARSLATTLAVKRATLTRDGLAAFLGASNATSNRSAREVARLTSPTGAAREIGAGVAKDAAALAADVGKGWMAALKAAPFLLLAGLGAWLYFKARR